MSFSLRFHGIDLFQGKRRKFRRPVIQNFLMRQGKPLFRLELTQENATGPVLWDISCFTEPAGLSS